MMTEVVMPQKRPCSKTPHLERSNGAHSGRLWPRPTAAPRCRWSLIGGAPPPESGEQPRPEAVPRRQVARAW